MLVDLLSIQPIRYVALYYSGGSAFWRLGGVLSRVGVRRNGFRVISHLGSHRPKAPEVNGSFFWAVGQAHTEHKTDVLEVETKERAELGESNQDAR